MKWEETSTPIYLIKLAKERNQGEHIYKFIDDQIAAD